MDTDTSLVVSVSVFVFGSLFVLAFPPLPACSTQDEHVRVATGTGCFANVMALRTLMYCCCLPFYHVALAASASAAVLAIAASEQALEGIPKVHVGL